MEYLFVGDTDDGVVERMDPCARAVTNSVGRCLVTDQAFAWEHPDFQSGPLNGLVIYEMYPATFAGTLDDAADRLDHLADLGVNREVEPGDSGHRAPTPGYSVGYTRSTVSLGTSRLVAMSASRSSALTPYPSMNVPIVAHDGHLTPYSRIISAGSDAPSKR